MTDTDTGDEHQPRPLSPNAPTVPGRWHADADWQRLEDERDALRALLTEVAAALAPLYTQYVHPGNADDCTVMARFTAGQVRRIQAMLRVIKGEAP